MPVTAGSETTPPLPDGDAENQQARFERLISQAADAAGETEIESGAHEMPFHVSSEAAQKTEPPIVNENAYVDQPRAHSDQLPPQQPSLESTPQPDYRVNRTLSQIEEEEDEDAHSNNLTASHIQYALTPGPHAAGDKSVDAVSPAYLNTSGNLSRDEIMATPGPQAKAQARNSLIDNFTSPNGPQIII